MNQALHIFNGDCVFEKWKNSGGTGDSLILRETYLEGPLRTEPDTIENFCHIRAEFLHEHIVPEYSADRLEQFLIRTDCSLTNTAGFQEAVLWFDECIFDFTLLIYTMNRLAAGPHAKQISLICSDSLCSADPGS